MVYSMRDVNRMVMQRGWARMAAMEYCIDIAHLTDKKVSDNLKKNYAKEVVKFDRGMELLAEHGPCYKYLPQFM
tara:strand:+ start:102 stop:323 length:222 start_codon:yes stop_codon:yes gene_type:complete